MCFCYIVLFTSRIRPKNSLLSPYLQMGLIAVIDIERKDSDVHRSRTRCKFTTQCMGPSLFLLDSLQRDQAGEFRWLDGIVQYKTWGKGRITPSCA